MNDDLLSLRTALLNGMKLSMQGSYARRQPSKKAIPYLESARQGLYKILDDDKENIEACKLLSQAEECLLNYPAAISYLERAIALSNRRNKKDLKKLALLNSALAEWNSIPLSPLQLDKLGKYLVKIGVNEKSETLEHTTNWLKENHPSLLIDALEGFEKDGAISDFQILYNVIKG